MGNRTVLDTLKRLYHSAKKEPTQSITYRLPQSLVNKLDTESAKRDISQNVLVRQILGKYVNWDRFADRMDMISAPKTIIGLLCRNLDDKGIDEMVDAIFPAVKDSVTFSKGGYDLKRCIETLEDYMGASGVDSDHRVNGDTHMFIIQHDLGVNWSLFSQRVLLRMFRSFLPEKDLEFQVTDSTVILSVSLGSDFNEHDY